MDLYGPLKRSKTFKAMIHKSLLSLGHVNHPELLTKAWGRGERGGVGEGWVGL